MHSSDEVDSFNSSVKPSDSNDDVDNRKVSIVCLCSFGTCLKSWQNILYKWSSCSWHFLYTRYIRSPLMFKYVTCSRITKATNTDPLVDKAVTNRSRRVLPNILFSISRSIATAFSRFRNVCVNHALISFRYFRDWKLNSFLIQAS